VEDRSDFQWLGLIREVERLVDKFNETFPDAAVVLVVRPGSPAPGFDVIHQAFPIVNLAVWRNSKMFFQFSVRQKESSFATGKAMEGRVDMKADDNSKVHMISNVGFIGGPTEAAEYLLDLVLPVIAGESSLVK
jgi:hypothetical protein